ncbi:glucosaminidase domain-containing protein [Lutibacter sp.]
MKLKYILICLLTISFLVGCKSKKKLARKSQKEIVVHQKVSKSTTTNTKKNTAITNSTIQYIERYKDIAMEEMRVFKIPASITLAQGILESSSGNSLLTKKSNNHFGIKCHKGWKGKKVYHDDDEKGECFRVYKHPNNSFKDHSKFLATRNRYAKLFKLRKGDYVKWAKGLSEAGYATDRRYPAKLIALIEKYDLHKYDTEVLGKPFKKIKNKNISNHIVSKGDTLYSISKKYGLTVDELKKLNGLNSNNITVGQTLILK